MLNIYKLFTILSFVRVSYCCGSLQTEKTISSEIDHIQEFIFPWLVMISDISEVLGLLYGGLIHPKAVLTCAVDLGGHNISNLIVQTNCDVDIKDASFQNCTTRNVMKIIYPDNYDGQPTPEKFYALLILTTPFDITPTIGPVNLINSMELVDEQSCFVTHWLRVHDIKHNEHGIVTEAFYIPYINGSFDMDAMDYNQMKESRDFIIKDAFYTSVLMENNKTLPLVFSGSPLVCYDENLSMHYQVGIATFAMKISLNNDQKSVTHEGSSFLIVDYFDEIMKKLEENVS